jgi:hypothetical protein
MLCVDVRAPAVRNEVSVVRGIVVVDVAFCRWTTKRRRWGSRSGGWCYGELGGTVTAVCERCGSRSSPWTSRRRGLGEETRVMVELEASM